MQSEMEIYRTVPSSKRAPIQPVPHTSVDADSMLTLLFKPNPYSCTCGESFPDLAGATADSLERHLAEQDRVKKMLQGDRCFKSMFKDDKSRLKEHAPCSRNPVRAGWVCPQNGCHISFVTSKELEQHLRENGVFDRLMRTQ